MWEKIRLMNSACWHFVAPFLRQMMSQAGPILAAAALEAVKASVGGGSSLEKRQKAFTAVQADLTQRGIVIGTSMINAAIELAVVSLKEK